MDTFRPPFPSSQPHQLCPGCMTPHFPFCPPYHVPVGQRHESFYSAQQVAHLHHGAFNPHLAAPLGRGGPHVLADPRFQGGRPTEFNPRPSYFIQGHPPHFGEDRRDRVSYGQVQSGVSQFSLPDERSHSSNGSMHVDPGRMAWIGAERDFAYQQQRRYVEMGEVPESAEHFLPRMHAAELPRVDATSNLPKNRYETGSRNDCYAIADDGRVVGRDLTKHNHAMESFTSMGHGRSEYEPLNDALGARLHGNNLQNHLKATEGSYDSRGAQVFVSNKQHISTGGAYSTVGDIENSYQAGGLQRREHETLADQNPFAQQGVKRDNDLVQQSVCHAETYEQMESMQVQDNIDNTLVKKGVKRKHGLHPLSREEELLIEKGLLDDDLSERQLHESIPLEAQEGNEELRSRHKPGGPEEKEGYYQQLGYQSSTLYAEREALGESAERNYESMQYLRHEGQRNKRQEVEMERGIPNSLGDWQHENLNAGRGSVYGPTDSRMPSHLVGQHPQFDGVQTNKDFLYRQYLEWEAEEKHMEALRRAERLAREIQQREENKGMFQPSSGQSEDLRKQDVLQDTRLQPSYQHLERPEISEASSEHNMMQGVGISLQHPAHQNLKCYSDASHFQEPGLHNQSLQQHARDNFIQDVSFADPYRGVLQSRQPESLVQLPAMSPQSQWLKEHTQHQPHIDFQRKSQPVLHHDQQVTFRRSMHSHYPRSAAEELSQERFDRGSSLSSHGQLGSGIVHESSGSFPPLPSAASVDPLPPDSPPPPLPPTHPPPNEAPPLPPSSTAFASARRNFLQGSLENPQQSLPPDSQALQDSHSAVHTGLSHAHNVSQFLPQPPQPLEKSKIVDAVNVFRNPGRFTRPDRFVVILRGLPGSGKSYLAKALRDVEVMNGGSAPRIHSMDDYFTCEVEKEEEVESGPSRSKKKVVKRVMEYCYEPEMEEAYRASMLKAFRKTLEEGMFKFVIVDDRNVPIADFAQFWAVAKRSGYEAYILEAPYSDVKGCAARNIHSFTEQQIQSMTEHWESTPSLYLKMDVSSLFRADDLSAQDIIEVDMDADDMERDLEEEEKVQSVQNHPLALDSERPTFGDRWEDKMDQVTKTASLAKSRQPSEVRSGSRSRRKSTDNALSGLMTTYGKKDKFVHWSDNQGGKGSSMGFSIGSSQKTTSLVIGPGSGYNGMSNLPVMGDDSTLESTEMRKSNKFVEQLRAEQEAFKAVFVRRRQRIRGMDDEDDD